MWTDVGVTDESSSPLLPAGRLINQSQSDVVQPVWINVHYSAHTHTHTHTSLCLGFSCFTSTESWENRYQKLSFWFFALCVDMQRPPVASVAPQPVVTQDQLSSSSSSSSGTQTGDTLEPGDTTRGQVQYFTQGKHHRASEKTWNLIIHSIKYMILCRNLSVNISVFSEFWCSYWIWQARWGGEAIGQTLGGSCCPAADWRFHPPEWFETMRSEGHELPEPPRPL